MRARDGSTRTHSPLDSNNQQGGKDASRTSDNAVNNWSPQTGCCCKLWQVLIPSSLLIVRQLANHAEQHLVEAFHLSIALSGAGCGSALLDAEGSTKFLHQGRCEVRTPITQ